MRLAEPRPPAECASSAEQMLRRRFKGLPTHAPRQSTHHLTQRDKCAGGPALSSSTVNPASVALRTSPRMTLLICRMRFGSLRQNSSFDPGAMAPAQVARTRLRGQIRMHSRVGTARLTELIHPGCPSWPGGPGCLELAGCISPSGDRSRARFPPRGRSRSPCPPTWSAACAPSSRPGASNFRLPPSAPRCTRRTHVFSRKNVLCRGPPSCRSLRVRRMPSSVRAIGRCL